MTPLHLGALVVIAARALEEDVPAVLGLVNAAAAEAAPAEAARADADTAGAPPAGAPPAGAPAAGTGSDAPGRAVSGAPGRAVSGTGGRDRSGAPGHDPETRAAARAAALLSALVEHRPLARGNQQVAVLATVTFLAVNGWQVDLEPAGKPAPEMAARAPGGCAPADLN